MGELNKKKRKHDHSLTDLLKVGIFSLVMMAPFISVGVRCGYVMWNKNAKDSYSLNTTNFEHPTTLTSGNEYYIYSSSTNVSDTTPTVVNGTDFTLISSNYPTVDLTQATSFSISSNGQFILLYNNDTNYQSINLTSYFINFKYNYISIVNNNSVKTTRLLNLTYIDNEQVNTLDNAFSYSIAQISNDPVFNWTRNTGIYTPINAMVTGLEIENDTLQILLAYWSLMTAVYIVFDLIIFCFTKLTHFINE